mgnify:CR=1 FL=1
MVDGKWVPTFPNASYLMGKKDLEFWGSIDKDAQDDFLQIQRRVFDDSLQPVLDAGLAKPVEGPAEVCEGVRLIPFDVDNDTAVATRRKMFGEYADTPTLIIGTHFAGPTAGRLVTDGDTYRLDV